MFRGRNSYLDWVPQEGDKVEARAVVTLYEARGDFQLTVEFLQRAGLGSLYEAFEKLKAKLQSEGLFDKERKKPIPEHPRQIGIITSPDAAALHDVLSTLRRRMPNIPVIIYPTPVQGKGASEKIAQAINTAASRNECDILILCRGGGSIEDLWQFNEEVVARAIASCPVPLISGVGHETDFTIADFAADQRAPTPTGAAEMATPDRTALLARIHLLQERLNRQISHQLQQKMQTLDFLGRRLLSPSQQVTQKSAYLLQLELRYKASIAKTLETYQQRVRNLAQNLNHLNPEAVLSRGYALVYNESDQLIHSVNQVAIGENVRIILSDGKTLAKISQK